MRSALWRTPPKDLASRRQRLRARSAAACVPPVRTMARAKRHTPGAPLIGDAYTPERRPPWAKGLMPRAGPDPPREASTRG